MQAVRADASRSLQRAIIYLIGALILVGGMRVMYLRLFVTDRAALRESFAGYPDRDTPSYPVFLRAVAAATPPGARIAIFVPMRHWDGGYSYAYYRAGYLLAGREVLPLVWRDDRVLPENAARAEYIASWHREITPPGFKVVLRVAEGELLKRL